MGATGCETRMAGRKPLGFVMCYTAGYGTAQYPPPHYRHLSERELFDIRWRWLTGPGWSAKRGG